MCNALFEPSRKLSVIGEFDVVVAGGGVAGCAAALAAARNGASVCLIEKEHALGGLATLGLIVVYLPLCDGMGNQVIAGLGEELLKLSVKYGPGEIPVCWRLPSSLEERAKQRYSLTFNPASFAIALEELLLQNGVDLLYDNRFCNTVAEEHRIIGLVVENKSGRCAVRCKVAVDATGDADICHMAGEETVVLNTNRRSGWFYSFNGQGRQAEPQISLQTSGDSLYEELPAGSRIFSGVDWRDVSDMNVETRKIIMQRIKTMTEAEGKEGAYPLVIPSIPQFRMTRRLKGDIELDESDDKRIFEDSVGLTGDWRKAGPIYSIPYRALAGRVVGNLLTAGRCISATTSAWDITRVIPTCAVTGEAAGTAAAMAAAAGVAAWDLDIKALQKQLASQGVIL